MRIRRLRRLATSSPNVLAQKDLGPTSSVFAGLAEAKVMMYKNPRCRSVLRQAQGDARSARRRRIWATATSNPPAPSTRKVDPREAGRDHLAGCGMHGAHARATVLKQPKDHVYGKVGEYSFEFPDALGRRLSSRLKTN